MYDINKIREDFPILSREVYGKPLIYLDNGATTQKPRCVVEAITNEYYSVNANVHRGVHFLSQQATELHEASRETVRRFINARSTNEIIFTRGTTESINLLASSFADSQMQAGDEVIVSTMEHHSNIVPWQLQAAKKGIVIKVIPMNDKGELLQDEYKKLFSEKTKLVCVMHVSNVLGTVNPVKEMIVEAHAHGVPVLVDGAQSVPHMKVDVQDQGDHYLLETDLPGVSRENVHVDVNNGVLTISAEMNKSDERKDENGNYLYRERRYGKTSRAFNLDGIRDQDITAEFKDGVLRLNLPKLEEIPAPTARAIEIR